MLIDLVAVYNGSKSRAEVEQALLANYGKFGRKVD